MGSGSRRPRASHAPPTHHARHAYLASSSSTEQHAAEHSAGTVLSGRLSSTSPTLDRAFVSATVHSTANIDPCIVVAGPNVQTTGLLRSPCRLRRRRLQPARKLRVRLLVCLDRERLLMHPPTRIRAGRMQSKAFASKVREIYCMCLYALCDNRMACAEMAMVCVAMAFDTHMLRFSQVRVDSSQLPVAKLPRAVAMSAIEPRQARVKVNLHAWFRMSRTGKKAAS